MLTLSFVMLLLMRVTEVPCKVSPETFCFSPGHCDDRLVALFDNAKTSIDVAIYSINREPVAKSLLAAKARGVAVRILLDNLQSHNTKEQRILANFQKAGIEFHVQHHTGIMHLKVAIVDVVNVAWGSFNWTDPAVEHNDEVLSVLDCPQAGEKFEAEYEVRWKAAKAGDERAAKEPKKRKR